MNKQKMGEYLVEVGFVEHRVNKTSKKEQVKITDSGVLAYEMLLDLIPEDKKNEKGQSN